MVQEYDHNIQLSQLEKDQLNTNVLQAVIEHWSPAQPKNTPWATPDTVTACIDDYRQRIPTMQSLNVHIYNSLMAVRITARSQGTIYNMDQLQILWDRMILNTRSTGARQG